MSYLQAVVLALVQGITEFLPISSSAHLVLVPKIFGWPDQGLGFDIATNTGTLLAVIAYFRKELADYAVAALRTLTAWRRPRGDGEAEGREGSRASRAAGMAFEARVAWLVALATIPVAVAGFLAYDLVGGAARSPAVIATTSIVFGLLLWWADAAGRRDRELASLTVTDAVVVGLAQALALIPGTSRSGITITAALGRRFTREDAARFSFLLYVPVGILAAAKGGLEIVQDGPPAIGAGPLLVGFALSAVAAFFTIGALMAWVRRRSMTVFVVYRVVLGLVIFAAL